MRYAGLEGTRIKNTGRKEKGAEIQTKHRLMFFQVSSVQILCQNVCLLSGLQNFIADGAFTLKDSWQICRAAAEDYRHIIVDYFPD